MIIFTAALNVLVYLICIFSIFTKQNKDLPDSFNFKVTDIIAYSGLLVKEFVFFIYILYISSNINDIHESLLSSIANKDWDENELKRLGLLFYIMINPINFQILGLTTKKKNINYTFVTFISFTLFYLGARVYYFYKILT